MDAVEYLKERDRATKNCEVSCDNCVPGAYDNKLERCLCVEDSDIEKAVQIIEKWSNEHPRKTMLQYFVEQHPKAKLDNGTPMLCPYHLGYIDEDKIPNRYCCNFDCMKCWTMPMEE